MAQHAHTPKPNFEKPQPPERAGRAPPHLSVVPAGRTETRAEPERPAVGVHRGAIEIGLAAAVWFVAAMLLLFATNNAFVNYTLVVVAGFAVMFFTLTLSLASRAAGDKRWSNGSRTTFSDFVNGNVDIESGTIAGREALVQIVMLPIVLAAGATLIGIIYVAGW